jgi:hypothetical protein
MRYLLAFIFCILPLFAYPGSGNMYTYQVRDNSWVSLSGTTNVNSFTCTSHGDIPRGFILADILPGSNAIYFTDAQLGLKVASFDCQNRMMNKDLHEALGGTKSPYISIDLVEIRPHESVKRGDEGKVRATVVININGQKKHTDITVDFRQGPTFDMVIAGSRKLKMSDFGIDPPSPALGLVRVRDEVTIQFHLFIETSLITESR